MKVVRIKRIEIVREINIILATIAKRKGIESN